MHDAFLFRPARRGFSFVELLFAVGVMGIGFIMIAAVFPIGLQQTKLTLDETAAAAGARGSAARLQRLGGAVIQYAAIATEDLTSVMPPTAPRPAAIPIADRGQSRRGQVRTFNDARPFTDLFEFAARRDKIWQSVSSESINPSDTRNAALALYRRDAIIAADPADTTNTLSIYAGAGTAQLITINAQVGNNSEYKTSQNVLPIQNLEPRPVAIQVVYDPRTQNYVASFFSVRDLTGAGQLARGGYPAVPFTITKPPGSTLVATVQWDDVLDAAVDSVAEGAFVVISDDRIDAVTPTSVGRLNGRILRLGARRLDLAGVTFDLAPGYSFTPDPGVDGYLNSTAPVSNDDLVAIGADGTTTLKSGITAADYTAAIPGSSVDRPLGPNGPSGTGITIASATPASKGAVALVLGRGFSNPDITPSGVAGGSSYTGPVQDVSAYTTFVTVTANP